MKKIYFGLFILASALVANAQSLSQGQHAYAVGDSYSTTAASTIAPGASGSGVTWNFASVTTTSSAQTDYTVVSPASTGSASSYPSADAAVQTGGNNTFYSSTSTEQRFWGGQMTISGYNLQFTYSSPALVAVYPAAFNATGSSTVAGSVFIPAPFNQNATFTGNSKVNVDGLGTLNLPSRTFTNVLRVVTSQTIAFSTGFATGTVTLENYEYYSTNYFKTPLYTISNATLEIPAVSLNSSQSTATVRADYLMVGVDEISNEISNLKIYPNPAKSSFNLAFNNDNGSNASYEIINALGQRIRKEALGNEKGNVKYHVNLDGIESGIYFVKISAGNSSSVQKITVQ